MVSIQIDQQFPFAEKLGRRLLSSVETITTIALSNFVIRPNRDSNNLPSRPPKRQFTADQLRQA